MAADREGLDRLLPRHDMPFDLEIEWDIQLRRSGLRRTERGVGARIRELSLSGALIEVPMPSSHEPGDRVRIRVQGDEGHAIIRHSRESTLGNRMLYGVHLEPSPGLTKFINKLMEGMRGPGIQELRADWER